MTDIYKIMAHVHTYIFLFTEFQNIRTRTHSWKSEHDRFMPHTSILYTPGKKDVGLIPRRGYKRWRVYSRKQRISIKSEMRNPHRKRV